MLGKIQAAATGRDLNYKPQPHDEASGRLAVNNTETKAMAKKPTKKKSAARSKTTDPKKLRELVDQYEQVFDEVEHFVELIRTQDGQIGEAQEVVYKTKDAYERAKADLLAAREARDGTKHALFMFLKPGPAEILPLFDRMDPADEEKHGEGSTEWRKEPVSALRLSLVATNLLTAADVIFVGQLQDRIQADADQWWEKFEGLTAPMAAAIADRLNEFIEEHTT